MSKNTAVKTIGNVRLIRAAKRLIEEYWANKDSEHEFITCITPGNIPRYWRELDKAIKAAE